MDTGPNGALSAGAHGGPPGTDRSDHVKLGMLASKKQTKAVIEA